MTNSATDPSKTVHWEPRRFYFVPEHPYDDDDDDDDADFDDDEEPSIWRNQRWSSRAGFGSPEWWSRT